MNIDDERNLTFKKSGKSFQQPTIIMAGNKCKGVLMNKKQSLIGEDEFVENSNRDPFEGQTNNGQMTQIRTTNSENFTEDAELAVDATASEPSRSLVYQGMTLIKPWCSEMDRQLEEEVDDER